MSQIDAPDFPTFFTEVTGREPFEWQADLADQLIGGSIPDAIDIPTGLGKTSVIHCWAYALAMSPATTPLPRRLCFVVDRRLVVDAAHEEATRLSRILVDSSGKVAVRTVAERLASLQSQGAETPLEVVRMRGGATWDSRWLRRPDQAAVVVGTIDQFGSRLLFRGYGVSDGMRPIDAALVGTDAWLVIDEAHIAEALVKTAASVSAYQSLAGIENRVARPLQVTRMSATLASAMNVFQPDLERQGRSTRFPESARAAKQRLDAQKPARLVELEKLATGSPKRRHALTQQLGKMLSEQARAIDPAATIVGVIANTVATARAAHDELAKAGEDACLLIGRCREYERAAILRHYESRLRAGSTRSGDEDRLYLVATQTVEVGADFDLDAIVTECAPLPSLIQRFGRVNRLGSRAPFESAIVYAHYFHGDENDPIYGAATQETWKYLRGRCVQGEDLDFGVVPARELTTPAPPVTRSEAVFVPTLLGTHIERWAATRPAPFPDQNVAPFLHGFGRSVPEVSVAWRAAPAMPKNADSRQEQAIWQQWLDLVRPVEWEFVNVPVWELRSLIAGQPSLLATSDLETAESSEAEDSISAVPTAASSVLGVVYRGPGNEPRLVRDPGDIAVGDRIVLDSAVGGHDRWGWTGRRAEPDTSVPDVADIAPSRTASSIRLDPWGRVLASLANEERVNAVKDLVEKAVESLAEHDADDLPSLDFDALEPSLRILTTDDLLVEPARALLQRALDERWDARISSLVVDGKPVLLLEQRLAEVTPMDAVSDDDEGSTSSAARPQLLTEHSVEVRDLARRFAEALALPERVATTVALAAHWHDTGKVEQRFQAMLHDGDNLGALSGDYRAKSGRDWRDPVARQAARLAGLPAGFRHEAVSGRLAQAVVNEDLQLAEQIDPDLLHHLIVSHHGHARPLLPAINDASAPAVDSDLFEMAEWGSARMRSASVKGDVHQVDWDHPTRFQRLNERYGWWGLALLEALVRLADMECSSRIADNQTESTS